MLSPYQKALTIKETIDNSSYMKIKKFKKKKLRNSIYCAIKRVKRKATDNEKIFIKKNI